LSTIFGRSTAHFYQSLPYFRRQNNHPRKLHDRGHKVKSDPGEERPECAEQGGDAPVCDQKKERIVDKA
jgi:hypothetical protein